MASRRILTVQTPLGHRVFLSRDRWRQIIRFKHPALAGRKGGLRSCLSSLFLIRESTKEPEVHLYYAITESLYLRVVTAPADAEEHFVVTAYLTKNIKPGNEIWKS